MVSNVKYPYDDERARVLHGRAVFAFVAAGLLAAFGLMSLWGSGGQITIVWGAATGAAVAVTAVGLMLYWSARRVGSGPRTDPVRSAARSGRVYRSGSVPVRDQGGVPAPGRSGSVVIVPPPASPGRAAEVVPAPPVQAPCRELAPAKVRG